MGMIIAAIVFYAGAVGATIAILNSSKQREDAYNKNKK